MVVQDLSSEKFKFEEWSKGQMIELFESAGWEHPWELCYDLKAGDTYVEAGAFWGRYGKMVSNRVGSSGRVILIEPDPQSCKVIETIVEHYGLDNVTIIQKAVGNFKGTVPYVVFGNPAGHKIADPSHIVHPVYSEYITEVEIDMLDNILKDLEVDRVDLLSCDVEGSEMDLVLGAKHYFSNHLIKHLALGAYHADHLPQGETFPDRIIPVLTEMGYVDLHYRMGIIFGHIPSEGIYDRERHHYTNK